MKFGLITEGITDQIIIRHIIFGYFNNPSIQIEPLQPPEDMKGRQGGFGNWLNVIKYCKSQEFEEAFPFFDYIVIHIDTDRCEDKGFDINNGLRLTPEKLIQKVKDKFDKDIFPSTVAGKYLKKIVYAIAVHQVECWLLPLYAHFNANKNKIVGCTKRVNKLLRRRNMNALNKNDRRTYEEACKKLSNHKTLMKIYKDNPSLKHFVEELKRTG